MTSDRRRSSMRLGPLLAAFLLLGCQQKMARQPSYKPLEPATFFPDGQSARPRVAGTVARGHLRTDLALFTGKTTAEIRDWTRPAAIVGAGDRGGLAAAVVAVATTADYVDTVPFPVTRDVLRYGRDRFTIYCAVCHDPLGTGWGKIVERGYTAPPSYHIERLRQAPVGYFFAVMTHGYGSMPSYAAQVPPRDRWAIAAYIQALQLSQHYPEKDVTDAMRREWKPSGPPMPGEGQQP